MADTARSRVRLTDEYFRRSKLRQRLSGGRPAGSGRLRPPPSSRCVGHHSAAAIIAMIYLCCGGITVALPTGRRGEPILAMSQPVLCIAP